MQSTSKEAFVQYSSIEDSLCLVRALGPDPIMTILDDSKHTLDMPSAPRSMEAA